MSISASIIVPLYEGMVYLKKLIPILDELNSRGIDTIFIDSSSSDGSASYIRKHTRYSVVQILSEDFDHGGSRAMAKTLSDSDVQIFITQDALPLSVIDIENLIKAFKDETIAAAFGCQISYKETSLFGKHLRKFNYGVQSYIRDINDTDLYGIKTAFLSNSFAAYRRSAMDEIGWFKDGLILGEDTYAGAKLLKEGYKLAYVADAQVYHSHSYTVLEDFKRYFDIGVFHQMEEWILDEFGKPEGEGMRYIKSELTYLFSHNAYYLFPEFVVRNAMKYLGYKLGRNFEILPRVMIKKFSMHHRWWNKHFKETI
jgi:rhamnosyltransferase